MADPRISFDMTFNLDPGQMERWMKLVKQLEDENTGPSEEKPVPCDHTGRSKTLFNGDWYCSHCHEKVSAPLAKSVLKF